MIDLTGRIPTPTQWAFHRDRTLIKGLLGGLGSGKTSSGAEAFVDLVIANPGCPLLMAGPTHEMTMDICVPAFEAACPRELIQRHVVSRHKYLLRGGREVKYASADKPSSLEGRNLAGFWADEARYWKRRSWQNLIARLRLKSARQLQGLVTSTPAPGWLEDEFDTGRSERRSFSISTMENAHNLAPGYVDNLRRSYSPRLAKSLIDGLFSVVDGQVYEEFDEATHVIDWQYDPRHALWLSWDFGIRAASILFAQLTGDFPTALPCGRVLPPHSVIVFDELQTEQKPTIHQIPDVKRRLAGRIPDRVVCDPAGKQRSQDTGIQNVALLRDAFGECVRYETEMSQRHITSRIARVSGALQPVEGSPSLYFARGLTRHPAGSVEARRGVIKAMRGSVYPEREGRRLSDHPKEDELEHARDSLEYCVIRAQNETRYPVREGRASIAYGRRP